MRDTLEKVQNECLRIMTRMAKTTPIDFLRLQAGVEPLEARIEKSCLIQREKYMRLKETDARRKLMEAEVKTRLLTRKGWREQTKGMVDESLNRRTPSTQMNPMLKMKATITEVILEKKKEEYTLGELAQLTELKIADIDADVELYTDCLLYTSDAADE